MYAPPVICKHVEDTENDNEEDSGPLGFEADGYHTASSKTKKRNEHPGDTPFSLEDESKEQENENAPSRGLD